MAMKTHTNTHARAQRGVGSIPTVAGSSWANQIINLQGLNYIASVHTYCHIRDTAIGIHTPSFCLSSLPHTYTPETHRQRTSNTTLEPCTGSEGLAHDMNRKVLNPMKAQSLKLFVTFYWSFLAYCFVEIS